METDRGFIGTNAIGGTGNGGDVTLNIPNLVELIGGADSDTTSSLVSATFGLGDAGRLTLNTSKVLVENGAAITASTFFNGEAGGVVINASDSVEVNGGFISSSAFFAPESLRRLFGLPLELKGFSGDVFINTSNLRITNGGLVTVRNDGLGNAGILNINTESVFLDRSAITATTQSGEGGNIKILSQDIRMFNGSQISATAGGAGNGGNVTLNTNLLILTSGSFISANAFEGNGGNISLKTPVLFQTADSSITASSQLGIEGTIEIDTTPYNFDVVKFEVPTQLSPSQVALKSCYDYGQRLTQTGQGQTQRDNNRAGRTFEDLIPMGQVVSSNVLPDGRVQLLTCQDILKSKLPQN